MQTVTPWVNPPRPSGPVDPLPLPPGAIALPQPIQVKVDGWVKLKVDAYLVVDGVYWGRTEFGDGQKTGWYPREDWIALIPGLSVSVTRDFRTPTLWDGEERIEDAMRAAVRQKLEDGRHRVAKQARALARIVKGMEILSRSLNVDHEQCAEIGSCWTDGAEQCEVGYRPEVHMTEADEERCDECGAVIPRNATGVTGAWHEGSCSAYEPRFWLLDGIEHGEPNRITEVIDAAQLPMTGLVDEESGGVVAYVTSQNGYDEELVAMLNRAIES